MLALAGWQALGELGDAGVHERVAIGDAEVQRPAFGCRQAADGLAFDTPWNSVSADYFATVGLPLLRGRAFTEAESAQRATSLAFS